jgi:hypothetical protein
VSNTIYWAVLGMCFGMNAWWVWRVIRDQRKHDHMVVRMVGELPGGFFCLWGGDPAEAPHCPRCDEPVAGVFSPSWSPLASVHTLPCDHVLQPDEGMALRMAAKVPDG